MARGLVASRTRWGVVHHLASAVSVACGAPYAVCVARLLPRVLETQVCDKSNRHELRMMYVHVWHASDDASRLTVIGVQWVARLGHDYYPKSGWEL